MPHPRRLPPVLGAASLFLAAATVGTLAGPLPALAQLPDSVVALDSVLVTVLRGSAGLGRTPFPVSIIESADLQLGNTGLSIEEALQGVPGVQVHNRYNFSAGERIAIRGFGARAQFGVRGIRVMVDGIPATLPDGQSTLDHVDLGSVGRVEVLRGPAAALYGNAGGGVISFQTRPPFEEPIGQRLRVVGGEDGLRRIESTTSGTQGDLGYVLNASFLSYDGFRTLADDPSDVYSRTDRLNVNAQVVTSAWDGELRITGNFLDLAADNPGSLPRSFLDDENFQAWNFNVVQNTRDDAQQGQLGLSWTGPLGNSTGELSAWGIVRKLDSPIPPSIIDLSRFAWGARAVVSTPPVAEPGRVQLVGGVEFEAQLDDRVNYENEGGARGAIILDQLETVRTIGLFAQLRAPVSARLSAVGGLRYDLFEFTADDHLVSVGGDESGDRTMDALSPTVGLHFQASPAFALYANIATSLQTPTTTELANRPDGAGGFNPSLDPTRGVTAEVGTRGQWAGRVLAEVNGFVTELDDELVPFEDAAQEGRTFFRNAGASTYAGIEGLLRVVLPGGSSGRIAYTFTDATFEDFSVDGESFDGNWIPGISRHRLDAVMRIAERNWYGEVRADYVGSVAVDDANAEFADAYTLFEIRTGLSEVPVGRTTISPFVGVANLFDEVYSASVAVNAFGGRFYEPGPRRSIFGGLSLSF